MTDLGGVFSARPRLRRSAAIVAWRMGQVLCGLCCLGAVLVLIQPNFGTAEQICVAALLLVGLVSLILGRALMMAASRRPRRRLTVY